MGSYNTAVITTVGQALLTSVLGAQGTMTFTKLQTSSYSYASGTDLSALTSLNNVEQEANIGTATIVDSTHIAAGATISNSGISTEYSVNTLGIFASDGVNEVLFAVSTAVTPDVIPVDSGGTPSTYKYKFTLAVSSTSDITISAGGDIAANEVSFDNTTSGLPATEVQTAIDVIDAEVDATRDAGAVNFNSYPYDETTEVKGGITFTDNGNGMIFVGDANEAQTASASVSFICHPRIKGGGVNCFVPNGIYNITGCPENGSEQSYWLEVARTKTNSYEALGKDVGNGVAIIFNGDDYSNNEICVGIYIKIASGTTIPAGGLLFKPMISDARLNLSYDDFVPYAKTNRELTTTSATQDELSNLVLTGATNTSGDTIAAGTCFVLNGDFVTAKADIAANATFTLNTNYEKKSVGSILSELLVTGTVDTFIVTLAKGYNNRSAGSIVIPGIQNANVSLDQVIWFNGNVATDVTSHFIIEKRGYCLNIVEDSNVYAGFAVYVSFTITR